MPEITLKLEHPIYENFLELWDLYGPSYDILKLCTFFILCGHAMRFRPIFFGKEKIDMRFNGSYVLKSGRGKQLVYNIMEKSINLLNEEFYTSNKLHADHLIGKKLLKNIPNPEFVPGGPAPRKIEVATDNPGILAKDYVAFDEAQVIINDPKKEEIRSIFKIAMNPMDTNKLVKSRVDVDFGNPLTIYPTCTIVFFMQPTEIDLFTVSTGLLRRAVLVYIEPTVEEMKDGINTKLTITQEEQIHLADCWDSWVNFLEKLKGETSHETFTRGENPIIFSPAALNEIKNITDLLWDRLDAKMIGAAKELHESMMSDVKKNCMRIAAILAFLFKRNKVIKEDAHLAGQFLYWILKSGYSFVEQYATGSTSRDMTKNMYDMVTYLATKNAKDERHGLTMTDFIETFKDITGLSGKQIRRGEIAKLKTLDMIDFTRGRNSRIWLTRKGLRRIKLE